jgi:hypothetical protein
MPGRWGKGHRQASELAYVSSHISQRPCSVVQTRRRANSNHEVIHHARSRVNSTRVHVVKSTSGGGLCVRARARGEPALCMSRCSPTFVCSKVHSRRERVNVRVGGCTHRGRASFVGVELFSQHCHFFSIVRHDGGGTTACKEEEALVGVSRRHKVGGCLGLRCDHFGENRKEVGR